MNIPDDDDGKEEVPFYIGGLEPAPEPPVDDAPWGDGTPYEEED